MAHLSSQQQQPLDKISADANVEENAAANTGAVGEGHRQQQPLEEYDIERVEKVYRKLDRRIIPGTRLFSPIAAHLVQS